jgi:hypothetical protein
VLTTHLKPKAECRDLMNELAASTGEQDGSPGSGAARAADGSG